MVEPSIDAFLPTNIAVQLLIFLTLILSRPFGCVYYYNNTFNLIDLFAFSSRGRITTLYAYIIP